VTRPTVWLRLAFLALLVVLVVHNVAWLGENQSEALPCRLRLWCEKPRDLGHLAATHASRKIRATDGIFIDLGNRIPGARLTIPAWMDKHHWDLTHVSRLRLTVSDEPMLVDPLHVAALRKGADDVRQFLRRGGSDAKRYQHLYFLIEEGVDEYVLAQEEAAERGALFLMPAARYEEVRLR
jgi:hypothetical protein